MVGQKRFYSKKLDLPALVGVWCPQRWLNDLSTSFPAVVRLGNGIKDTVISVANRISTDLYA